MFSITSPNKKPLSILEKTNQSLRGGQHATVFEVKRDPQLKNKDVIRDKSKPLFPFVGGSQYKGEWNLDTKEGFGIQINSDGTKYIGEWRANKYNGRGTLWVRPNTSSKQKKFVRLYVGDWYDGKMEGNGIYYYKSGDIYRGEWRLDMRSGKGRLDLVNGDNYNGEWRNDMREGFGIMNCENGNIFEGIWSKDMKEGPGLFYYASTNKIYEGEWADNQPRCGEYRSPSLEEESKYSKPLPKGIYPNQFSIPSLEISNPQKVLDLATSEVRVEVLTKQINKNLKENNNYQTDDYFNPGLESNPFSSENLEYAKKAFDKLSNQSSVIPIYALPRVLLYFGLNLSDYDVMQIVEQLDTKESQEVTFAEAVEIASYIHES